MNPNPRPGSGELAEIPAAHPARRAVEIAAAGGHHLALIGPGPGRALLAACLHALLPDLDEVTADTVAALRRAAGQPPADPSHRLRPPWQAPHHSTSPTSLLGNHDRPGLISLAHAGLLFLDEATSLEPAAINLLRQPLDHHHIQTRHAGIHRTDPADIQLLLGADGCPSADPARCHCPPGAHRRYLTRRLSGPLLDRIHLHAPLPRDPGRPGGGEDTATVVARVTVARAAATRRWERLAPSNPDPARPPAPSNARARVDLLQAAALPRRSRELLRHAVAVGMLSTRGALVTLRVAWTLADLNQHPCPTEADIVEALAWRTGDNTPR